MADDTESTALLDRHNKEFIRIMEEFSDVMRLGCGGHWHTDSYNIYFDEQGEAGTLMYNIYLKHTDQCRHSIPQGHGIW